MSPKSLEPLSAMEAQRLGQQAARALGEGPSAERVAAQRLRLAQASASPRAWTEWPRVWAVGGGIVAAGLAVGAIVLAGKWRSDEHVATARRPGIFAEPIGQQWGTGASSEHRLPEVGAADDEGSRGHVAAPVPWLLSRAEGETLNSAQGASRAVQPDFLLVGQRLDAKVAALTLETGLVNAETAVGQRRGQLRLERGVRARVVEATGGELVVNLEQGLAKATVSEGQQPLALVAGPFSVRPVTGSHPAGVSADLPRVNDDGAQLRAEDEEPAGSNETENTGVSAQYEVTWAPKTSTLRVTVKRGQVTVESDDDAVPRRIEAGHSVRLVASQASLHASARHASAGRPGTQPAPSSERDEKRGSASPPGNGTPTRSSTALDIVDLPGGQKDPATDGSGARASEPAVDDGQWRKLAENGQYAAAVKAAERTGFAQLEQSASPSDLLLLADTARLGGATQRARSVLAALRSRYPGHTNAATAAFTLGRMAQEQEHDDRRAIAWYRTYLREEPRGRMAEGARARLLKATLRVGSEAERAEAARDYLTHHPSGSSAAVARSMLVK